MSGDPNGTHLTGVFGGTFDPVHLGHLHAAEQVASVFALPRVLLVPAAIPPHKRAGAHASSKARLEMLRLAIERRPLLEVCALEIERGGTSYTIETLEQLRESGIVPLFVLGADSLAEIPTWREYERILRDYDLVAVDRPGSPTSDRAARAGGEIASRIVPVACSPGAGRATPGEPPGHGGRIYHLPVPGVDVSSSRVRARAAASAPLDGLVPPEVARYIQEQGIYRKEAAR